MPLEPLIDTSGLLTRAMRTARAVPLVVFGFVTLLLFNGLQTASLILVPFSRPAFRRINRWCAETWWGWCVVASKLVLGTRLVVTGEDLPVAENALLVANHQQMPDILALMILARPRKRLGDLKFFVKYALKWVPGLGWGLQFLGCPFLRRDWSSDRELIRRTFEAIVGEKIPLWLVSFVEGTRSTPDKIDASAEWAAGRGIEPFRHVLTPRSKGFVATVAGLRDHLDAVYDITIGYEDGIPTLWQYILGCVKRIHVHTERFPMTSLPTSDEALRDWLFDRFRTKDELLDRFYATGSFPEDDSGFDTPT